jgi:DNA-binding GntR family transcriptional regulator
VDDNVKAYRGRSLADQAYESIRDQLVRLEIRPGEPINEDQLSASLGMGRTPVHEALKRLALDRLVVAYARRGTFATDINVTDLAHIFEVRQALEPAAAASAARHATAADRTALSALIEDLQSGLPGRADELINVDMRVHRAIYAATHNPYLEETLVRYDNLATRIWCLFIDRLTGMSAHIEEHGPLMRAVLDADALKAAELARRHVTEFEAAIRSII